jgi:hypothetical protein
MNDEIQAIERHDAIIINWKGPYDKDEISYLEANNGGLYIFTGLTKYQRGESHAQYCGITTQDYFTRFRQHHKKELVTRNQEIWLGEIEYPILNENRRSILEKAEAIIIYTLGLNLNERKKVYAPKIPITILNRWYKKDGTIRYNHVSSVNVPDVISWDGLNWRIGQKLSIFMHD